MPPGDPLWTFSSVDGAEGKGRGMGWEVAKQVPPRVLLLYRMGQRSLVQWQLETKTRQRERSKVLVRDLFSSWLSFSSSSTTSASSFVTEKPIYSPSPSSAFHSDSPPGSFAHKRRRRRVSVSGRSSSHDRVFPRRGGRRGARKSEIELYSPADETNRKSPNENKPPVSLALPWPTRCLAVGLPFRVLTAANELQGNRQQQTECRTFWSDHSHKASLWNYGWGIGGNKRRT